MKQRTKSATHQRILALRETSPVEGTVGRRLTLLLLGAALFAAFAPLACSRRRASPSHPPVSYNENAGTVFIPNATIMTGGTEYFETAPLASNGLALVVTEDSSLYFYSTRLGDVDSLMLEHSTKAIGCFLLANVGTESQSTEDVNADLTSGVTLRTVAGNKVECANTLHRWAAVKVSPTDASVLLTPRSYFKVGLVDLFEGDMSNVFQFNRIPRDTVASGTLYDTYGGVARMAICPFTAQLLMEQGDAIKAGFRSDPEAFTCLQVLDGCDVVWLVVEAVSPVGAGTIAQAFGKSLFKTMVKTSVQGVLSDAVAQGSSAQVSEVAIRGLLDAVAEAIIRYGFSVSTPGTPPHDTVRSAELTGPEFRAAFEPVTVCLLILKAIKILVAGTDYVWGVYDAATHDAYASCIDSTASNNPPGTPTIPSGPTSGVAGISYEFSAAADDPDGDPVCIRFDWGDGDTSDWSDYVPSGSPASVTYAWGTPGVYYVRAQAHALGGSSDWSPAHGIVVTSTTYPYTIALTWGESPTDLDSHIWTPDIEGNSYHVYWSDRGMLSAAPYCSLDVDQMQGYGPEHISIGTAFPGEYTYAVNQYSSGTLSGSGAKVELYVQGHLSRTFTVPTEPANGRTWWYVFKLNGSTGAVTVLNTLEYDPPYSCDGLRAK